MVWWFGSDIVLGVVLIVCEGYWWFVTSISVDIWFVSGIGGLRATLVVVWWYASGICGEICKFASGIGGDMVVCE